MLIKLTRAEAHKSMDDGKVIWNIDKTIKAWRDDYHRKGPYLFAHGDNASDYFYLWNAEWYIEVEEPWRPVEGEAVYGRDYTTSRWSRVNFSHIMKDYGERIFDCGSIVYCMIAPVKGNEGSAGTKNELKNTLTAEDLGDA